MSTIQIGSSRSRCRQQFAKTLRFFNQEIVRFQVGIGGNRSDIHANDAIEHSRIEMVLPKHGPTDGADSMPE